MNELSKRIVDATWHTPSSVVVQLTKDWCDPILPPIFRAPRGGQDLIVERADPWLFGRKNGYLRRGEWIVFVLSPEEYPQIECERSLLYVAGDFNGWEAAIGRPIWQLMPTHASGQTFYSLSFLSGRPKNLESSDFKFATSEGRWLEMPSHATNVVEYPDGARNHRIDRERSGLNIFLCEFGFDSAWEDEVQLVWEEGDYEEKIPINMGDFFFGMGTETVLGASLDEEGTAFRLFAPRARSIVVEIQRRPDAKPEHLSLRRCSSGVWEARHRERLTGALYGYVVDGPGDEESEGFEEGERVLDPFALICLSSRGPGVVVEKSSLPKVDDGFVPPAQEDLVILEGHIRDLNGLAPITLTREERKGFSGLKRWVETEGNYLTRLGFNAIELQPIQEFDSKSPDEYHWGYMPVNFFAPSSSYAMDPGNLSQVEEFADMIAAFHRQGLAVILDVVYNHVGLPNHLALIDREYFFLLDDSGQHANWSGCGNTLRCSSPVALRLIIESLSYLVVTFNIDGFRLDLAELLGISVLREVERRLKAIKPSLILILEPWSFRGNIKGSLRGTEYLSWNDGYRDFMAEYVHGRGDLQGIRHFLSGSVGPPSSSSIQSLNYVESHDDHCWIDRVTENPEHNGFRPTVNDRRRTHLMIAILMTSFGVPMLAAGQDIFRSKQGCRNTYRQGELNLVDYGRIEEFPETHEYFREWIRFRLSDSGALLRQRMIPEEGFLQFFETEGSTAVGAFYNVDRSQIGKRLLFAVNPHLRLQSIPLPNFPNVDFRLIADQKTFSWEGVASSFASIRNFCIELRELSCGLWIES